MEEEDWLILALEEDAAAVPARERDSARDAPDAEPALASPAAPASLPGIVLEASGAPPSIVDTAPAPMTWSGYAGAAAPAEPGGAWPCPDGAEHAFRMCFGRLAAAFVVAWVRSGVAPDIVDVFSELV